MTAESPESFHDFNEQFYTAVYLLPLLNELFLSRFENITEAGEMK